MLSSFYIVWVQGSYGPWLRERALAPQPFWPYLRGKFILSNDHVLVRIGLCGAIVELAPKSNMTPGPWSCEQSIELFTFMHTSTQSWH